jgi:hypothetical protein
MEVDVIKKTDVEREEQFRKDIMDLIRSYEWELENTTLTLFNVNYVILVKTRFRAGTKRLYPEVNKFKEELSNILQKYGLKIQKFESNDKTVSNDLKYRRIEIEMSN